MELCKQDLGAELGNANGSILSERFWKRLFICSCLFRLQVIFKSHKGREML